MERTLLVRVPASALGRPSLEQLAADLRDVEADFCARLARTSAQRIALWPTSVGESWWVDSYTAGFAVSSQLHRRYLLYRLNQDRRRTRYRPLAALSQVELQ